MVLCEGKGFYLGCATRAGERSVTVTPWLDVGEDVAPNART